MKSIVFFFILFVELCIASKSDDLAKEGWSEFKARYRKQYDHASEEELRYKIYLDNRYEIEKHNKRYHLNEVPFKLAVNEFADMLHSEFVTTMNGFKYSAPIHGNLSTFTTLIDNIRDIYNTVTSYFWGEKVEIAESVDWREQGAVTRVKHQGQCGSCWSFSATGALEGHHFIYTGRLISLSEQNLIDCSRDFGNQGCKEGNAINSFKYIQNNGGIDTEESYKYEAIDSTCRFNRGTIGATYRGYHMIPRGNEEAMKIAVALSGPVSAAIDGSREGFKFYLGGVYNDPQCESLRLNHAVSIVGYGRDEIFGLDYWLVKNSWGESWGEMGYIRMARNKDNNCGIATASLYPLVG